MNATPSLDGLERKIATIRQALLALGPMHPGSVSRQYQICGRTGCRCMDPKQPRRHGPYHKLAYVHRGKPVCRFVRADCAPEIIRRLATYKTFRKLVDQWIQTCIQQGQIEFFSQPATPQSKRAPRAPRTTAGEKPTR